MLIINILNICLRLGFYLCLEYIDYKSLIYKILKMLIGKYYFSNI